MFFEAGVRDYLSKPFDPALLVRRVDRLLSEGAVTVEQTVAGQRGTLLKGQCVLPELCCTYTADDPARFFRRGAFQLDLHACNATLGARFLPLSPTAFRYLVVLLRQAPYPVTSCFLVHEAQGTNVVERQVLVTARRWISILRTVVEEDPRQPRYILTVRNTGYRLVP